MVDDPPLRAVALLTPDRRYVVVRGRLWRAANPALSEEARSEWVGRLMHGRRAVAAARRSGDAQALQAARRQVDAAKRGLGERGPVWWDDGAPDLSRHKVHTMPYAPWYAAQGQGPEHGGRAVRAVPPPIG